MNFLIMALTDEMTITENSRISISLLIAVIGAIVAVSYVAFAVKRVEKELPNHASRLRAIELNTAEATIEMKNIGGLLSKMEQSLSTFVTRNELQLLKDKTEEDHKAFDNRIGRLEEFLMDRGNPKT